MKINPYKALPIGLLFVVFAVASNRHAARTRTCATGEWPGSSFCPLPSALHEDGAHAFFPEVPGDFNFTGESVEADLPGSPSPD